MEGEDGVLAVVFAGEQRGKGLLFQLLLHLLHAGAAVVDQVEVALFVRKLDHDQRVVKGGLQIVIRLDFAFEQRNALQHLLRIGKVAPEVFIGGLRFQRFDFLGHLLQAERRRKLLQRLFAFQQPQPQFFKLNHSLIPFCINKFTYLVIIHENGRSGNSIFLFS